MPSQQFGLAQRFSAATAYDFDLAVLALGRLIEARLTETVEEEYTPPKRPPGRAVRHVPRHTLRALLTDPPEAIDPRDDDAPALPELAFLPTAGI